ncbi:MULTISPECIES: M23 family metallopeptidase [unclassified Streptomyces]|uniref:M23 family metallopeptidase n=1 Tax=unclassified Streptomyces TaxID=2593676 RepID=UPI0016611255|nr:MULTISPECIES: M23 family metallopeptidase [unclassified Streptomyces]MBD0711324.1 peptidase [Streptomyces sp. CBMA291]MBD0714879.1 peptidase [Streptomyces sp. CBMA370]
MPFRLALLALTLTLTPGPQWPVGPPPPPVVRSWKPPPGPYAPGHRGIDLGAPPGTPVLAPTTGTVTFAGPVGGRGVLTLTLPDTGTPPLRTTFTPVTPLVKTGTQVPPGTPIATVNPGPHCPENCLHWGLLKGRQYLNPLNLLHPKPSRLLPWGAGAAAGAGAGAGMWAGEWVGPWAGVGMNWGG